MLSESNSIRLKLSKFTSTLTLVISIIIVSPLLWASALEQLEDSEAPIIEEKQSRTTKLINYLIEKSHYRKIPLDDEFSAAVLKAYIAQLDPSRSFFLAEDIEQFERLKYEVDDFIKQGNIELAYSIFEIYRARVNNQIEFALQRLNEPFDFTIDEQFMLDRDDAQWLSSQQALNDYWRKRIKNDILNLRLSNKDEAEIKTTLSKRYTHIARRVRQFKSENVFQSFINAYVGTIEPHTSYYSPRGAENFKIHMRLSLEGIGAVLQTENEHTLVRRIIPGGPADLSGELKSDDRIIGVGQEDGEILDVIGWRLDDVVELIRGPKETIVNLEILPGENGLDGESEVVTIVRDKIKLEEQAANKRIIELPNSETPIKVGVIDLPSFYSDFDGRNVNDPDYRSTTRDIRKLLSELDEDQVEGLIIDLRGNGGGALSEAISLTGLFIKKGPVVQVQNSNGRTQVDKDPDPEIIYDGPLVVLVDKYSASASEIFAGAIQDYNRGLIIGEPTFGKGTVQNLVSLNRFVNTDEDLGQLKVTIAQFFRINGDSTQHRGVIPDISWHTSVYDENSGERAFENAIPWRHIDEVSYTPFDPNIYSTAIQQANDQHLQRVENNPQFIYALGANQINKRNRELTTISLSELERKKSRESRNMERLELENARRNALGKSTFNSIEMLEEITADEDKRQDELDQRDATPDAFLLESVQILVDFIQIKSISNSETSLVKQNSSSTETGLSN